MKLARIDSDETLARDLTTNAVINTSTTAFEEFIAKRKVEREREAMYKSLEDRVTTIESLLQQILTLLHKEDK